MIYLEDFAPGQKYVSGTLPVDAVAIKAFAAQFDPQPFHLDEDAARGAFFAGLAASGWHTAALTMRLLVGSGFRPAGGIIGSRAEELKWPRPVRPGDELHVGRRYIWKLLRRDQKPSPEAAKAVVRRLVALVTSPGVSEGE